MTRTEEALRTWMHMVFLLWLGLLAGAGPASASENLLAGAEVVQAEGVKHPERLTDGVAGDDGADPQTPLSTPMRQRASVTWDLGAATEIGGLWLVADPNGYRIELSDDGTSYREVLRSPPLGGPQELSTRAAEGLDENARYLRLTAGGKGAPFAVSELHVVSSPSPEDPEVERLEAPEPRTRNTRWMAVGAVGLLLAGLLITSGAPTWWNVALATVSLAALGWAAVDLYGTLPLPRPSRTLLRGGLALVAILTLLRAQLPTRIARAPSATTAVLAMVAVLSVASFFHFGRPPFVDRNQARGTWVHNYDMRNYFPTAKYFDELRYDGVYDASMTAMLEDLELDPARSRHRIRDLRTHDMRPVARRAERLEEVRSRFSDERWSSFKDDMRYFREAMGPPRYVSSMVDHGANATPIWMATAHLLFSRAPASELTLTLGALLDPLLLLAAFVAIGRSFGLRTALVAGVVFGANEFPITSSNWAGATLRHDWLALAAFGLCALRTGRSALGGALLAWSAGIRVFPGLTLAWLAVPVLWTLASAQRSQVWTIRRDELQALIGGTVALGVLFLVSILVLDLQAWTEWYAKVSMLQAGPRLNRASLAAVLAPLPLSRVLQLVGMAATAAAAAWASRDRPAHQTALLGLMLVPFVFDIANYYAHFVFLFPLLFDEEEERSWVGQCLVLAIGLTHPLTFDARWAYNTAPHFWWLSLSLVLGVWALLGLRAWTPPTRALLAEA